MRYSVSVSRTTYESREFIIEASNEEEAKDKANEAAADEIWDNYSNVDYEINYITETD